MQHIDEAVLVSRIARPARSELLPYPAVIRSNLGNKLGRRYERTGKMEDLEEALRVARQAVDVPPEDHPGVAGRLGKRQGHRRRRRPRIQELEERIRGDDGDGPVIAGPPSGLL